MIRGQWDGVREQRFTVVAPTWTLAPGRTLALDRPRILTILNLTPDSFSDGGDLAPPDALARTIDAAAEADADGFDIGGESTRPGAVRISVSEQIARTLPAIELIRKRFGDRHLITIDTTRSEVARHAFEAGADALNDVSACTEDDTMLPLLAKMRRGVILMHRLTTPERDRYSTQYAHAPEYMPKNVAKHANADDAAERNTEAGVVRVVRDYLAERTEAAAQHGIAREQIAIDPGLGFGKSVEQNLQLIRATPSLCALGYPVLSALSRKSFVAAAAGIPADCPPRDRAHATVGLSLLHMTLGARLFRVHDVAMHTHALRAVWCAMGHAWRD